MIRLSKSLFHTINLSGWSLAWTTGRPDCSEVSVYSVNQDSFVAVGLTTEHQFLLERLPRPFGPLVEPTLSDGCQGYSGSCWNLITDLHLFEVTIWLIFTSGVYSVVVWLHDKFAFAFIMWQRIYFARCQEFCRIWCGKIFIGHVLWRSHGRQWISWLA